MFCTWPQVVYILDQVRALEREMLARIAAQGLNIVPRILVITRLIPDAEVRPAACSLRHMAWALRQQSHPCSAFHVAVCTKPSSLCFVAHSLLHWPYSVWKLAYRGSLSMVVHAEEPRIASNSPAEHAASHRLNVSLLHQLRMLKMLHMHGWACQGTSCDQRMEHITGTQHAQILRIPFRSEQGVLRHWISRCAWFGWRRVSIPTPWPSTSQNCCFYSSPF